MKSQNWFASENFAGGYSKLNSPSIGIGTDDERFFKNAQKINIDVQNAYILDDMDGFPKGYNDIVISTKHRVGSKPAIDKLHYLKDEVPEEEFINDFFHSTIYTTTDFRAGETEQIMLQVKVYDQDGLSKDESSELQGAISTAAGAASLAFPVFAPIAGLATGVGSALVNLIDDLDNHDKIINSTIRLAVNKPNNRGYDHLQPGFLICFSKELDASNIYLGDDKKLYVEDKGKYIEYAGLSYIVIRISRVFNLQEDLILDEKASTLLSEIENGKGNKGTQALKFLRETFVAYNNFTRLQRYTDLQEKAKHETLSQDEQALLDEIKNDPALQKFLN